MKNKHENVASTGSYSMDHYKLYATFLIALLVTSLMMAPITFLKVVSPIEPWAQISLAILLIAYVESITTWRMTTGQITISHTLFRISEIVILVTLMRLYTWLLLGNIPETGRFLDLLLNPLILFDNFYVLSTLVCIWAWERSIAFTSSIAKVTLSRSEIDYYLANGVETPQVAMAAVDRQRALNDFFRKWIIGGVLLVLITVITTIDLPDIPSAMADGLNVRNIGRLGLSSGLLLAILGYFLLGFVLSSLARQQVLAARWLSSRLQTDGKISRTWITRSLLIVGVFALVAAFLPIGSTMPVSVILQGIIGLFVSLIAILISAVFLIFYGLVSLFGQPSEPGEPIAVDITELMKTVEPSETLTTPIPPYFSAIILWSSVAIAIILSLYFYLKHPMIRLRLNFIVSFIRNLYVRLVNFASGFSDRLETPDLSFSRFLKRNQNYREQFSGWHYIRVNALPYREQVRYFYLSIVKRARQEGVTRKPNQTPLEFQISLTDTWPESREDMEQLTQAFLKARYDTKDFSLLESGRIREIFKKVRYMIRQAKKPKNSSDPNERI